MVTISNMKKEELINWRGKYSYTQEELAQALGVFRETIARWETGTRKIPPYLNLALETLARRKKGR
jgi:DNA-binding XRE family transcriptional regulator